jgi:plastocyanin
MIRRGPGARSTSMNKILTLFGAILILATGAAAIGLFDGAGRSAPKVQATAAGSVSATHARVPIAGFAFKPTAVHVKVGGSVTWTNLDTAPHTATADQGAAFDTGTLMQNQHKTVTFKTAGSFTYHCAFHPFMTASVTVG